MRQDVHKYWRGTQMHDRCGGVGGDPIAVGHDHLIAGGDPQGMHAHVQLLVQWRISRPGGP